MNISVLVSTLNCTYSTQTSSWRDMKVYKDHAFIVAEAPDHGVQVFDLRQLRGKEEFSILEETTHYAEVGHAHNIVANIESGSLYVLGARNFSSNNIAYNNTCAGKRKHIKVCFDVVYSRSTGMVETLLSIFIHSLGGLHIVDVSSPAEPKFVTCFGEDGYVHDTECVIYHGPDIRYTGHEICFCYNEDTLTLVDVTNHSNLTIVSKTGYANAAYTHQVGDIS